MAYRTSARSRISDIVIILSPKGERDSGEFVGDEFVGDEFVGDEFVGAGSAPSVWLTSSH